MGTAIKSAHQFACLTAKKREIKAQLAEVQSLLNTVESELVDALVEEGVAKLTVDAGSSGQWTVSAGTLAWAKLKDGTQKQALEILKSSGMESLLTINSTKLSGLYREDVELRKHEQQTLPDAILPLIEVEERTKISARKV